MASYFPLPDIERARAIVDALGAMVVGEPCSRLRGRGRARPPSRQHSPLL